MIVTTVSGDSIETGGDTTVATEDIPDVHMSLAGEARCNGDEWNGAPATCTACGERLDSEGAAVDSGQAFDRELCPDNPLDDEGERFGPHDPDPVPLSWANSASIRVDESRDTLTVAISIGDPRGALTMSVERIRFTDAETGEARDELRLSVPHPGDSLPHVGLTPLASPGYYRIGGL